MIYEMKCNLSLLVCCIVLFNKYTNICMHGCNESCVIFKLISSNPNKKLLQMKNDVFFVKSTAKLFGNYPVFYGATNLTDRSIMCNSNWVRIWLLYFVLIQNASQIFFFTIMIKQIKFLF